MPTQSRGHGTRVYNLPLLPVGLYLRVGLESIGWDAYEEHFWDHRLLRFEYAYVGLPALPAEEYASGEHLLGVALSALMRTPRGKAAKTAWQPSKFDRLRWAKSVPELRYHSMYENTHAYD